jgi:ATP-dependent Clp protease protease subunit
MIHQPLGGIQGQASDIAITAQNILKTKARINKMLADATGKTIAQVEKDSDRDYWMSADEAKKYGIVDTILKPKTK